MPTAMTAQVSIDLPQSEIERIVSAASFMRMDGVASELVKEWMKAEVAKSVSVR
jgi:hypothetical protein